MLVAFGLLEDSLQTLYEVAWMDCDFCTSWMSNCNPLMSTWMGVTACCLNVNIFDRPLSHSLSLSLSLYLQLYPNHSSRVDNQWFRMKPRPDVVGFWTEDRLVAFNCKF